MRAPDPEVLATAKRRRFAASEKRRIVAEADACTKHGELGALLRRECIYSLMLANWRKQIARANEAALTPRQRGRKPDPARAEKVSQVIDTFRGCKENPRRRQELTR